jgi:PAS domain S-box-containing protein
MVKLLKGTVAFIKATDYLKKVKHLKHAEVAKNIGLSRSQYDQSRGGRRVVLSDELEKLRSLYPETRSFIDNVIDNLNEPAGNYLADNEKELVLSLRETILAKEEIIAMLKDRMELMMSHSIEEYGMIVNRIISESNEKVIMLTDEEGVTITVNDQLFHQTGYHIGEMIGKKPGELLNKEKQLDGLPQLRRSLEKRERFRGKLKNRHADGYRIICDLELIPMMHYTIGFAKFSREENKKTG